MPDMHPKSLLRSQILPMAFFFRGQQLANNLASKFTFGQLVLWDSAKSFICICLWLCIYIYIYTHSYIKKMSLCHYVMFLDMYILCLHVCIWNPLNMNIQVCIYYIYSIYIVSGKGRWAFLGTPILFIGSIHLSWDLRLWKDLSMIVLGVVQPSAWGDRHESRCIQFCHIFVSKAGFS